MGPSAPENFPIIVTIVFIFVWHNVVQRIDSASLSEFDNPEIQPNDNNDIVAGDWLLTDNVGYPARVDEDVCWDDGLCGIELSNGLISRRWILPTTEDALKGPFGTVDLLMTSDTKLIKTKISQQESILRTIEPEATFNLSRSSLKSSTVEYRVGDIFYNDTFKAYLNRTDLSSKIGSISCKYDNTTFRYISHDVTKPSAPFHWTPGKRHSLQYASWPPKGTTLNVHFRIMDHCHEGNFFVDSIGARFLQVNVHYELYDGIPVMAKWMTIDTIDGEDGRFELRNDVKLSSVTVERLASYPPYGEYLMHGALLPSNIPKPPPRLITFTDQAHGTKCAWYDDFTSSNDTATSDETPHDMGASEPLLICNYSMNGPGIRLFRNHNDPSQRSTSLFRSFRTYLLATDTTDLERQSLMRHRTTQVLLPHVTENPIFFHAVLDASNFNSTNHTAFRRIIDQMSDVGFEMLVYSFGSEFSLETANSSYIQQIKDQVTYARSKGIEVGGYDLVCLDRGHGGYGGNVGDEYARVDPSTGELTVDACFASAWYDRLVHYVFDFLNQTGISMLEADGPYGGLPCSSTNHTHHDGPDDSLYRQTQLQNEFFLRLREMGVYINQPDAYFFQGGSRTGMGYDEEQYSLPRWRQITISRMGLYDDLYKNLPTQGWMFVPLTEYHSGGGQATFADQPEELEWAVAQYLGAGTAACYRGSQVYSDTSTEVGKTTRSVFKRWISFYKAHRETIIQPIVHLRRPSMRSWDGWLHVHPLGRQEVGLAMIFNPTNANLENTHICFPLYYTSLADKVLISVNEKEPYTKAIDRDFTVSVVVSLPPKSIHTFVFQRPSNVDVEKSERTLKDMK